MTPATGTETSGARLSGGVVAGVVGLVALVVFMLQNRDDVTLTFLLWDFTWPVWLLTLAAAVAGALVWLAVGMLRRRAAKRAKR